MREDKFMLTIIGMLIMGVLIAAIIGLTLQENLGQNDRIDIVECTVVPHGDGTISLVRRDTGDQYFYENDEGREYSERVQVVFDNRNTEDVTDDYIVGFLFD